MRKTLFLICFIFLSIARMKELSAQNSISQEPYHDPRIIGTWQSVISWEDYYKNVPIELRHIRVAMEITFAEDSSYYMTVNTATVEEKRTESLFGGKTKITYNAKNNEMLTVKGAYHFDGDKLYIEDSDSRSMYLIKFMMYGLQEDITAEATTNISWDVKRFTLKSGNPFPAIINTIIGKKTLRYADGFYKFTKVK